jgi:3-dehydroquinate synthase
VVTVDVSSAGGDYPVRIGATLDQVVGELDRPAVVVTDDRVGLLWADAVARRLRSGVLGTVVLASGEANKTVATWSVCVDRLLSLGVDRKTPVVAVGGGVLGDVAGFAAAATLRGLPLVQVPTTLLAMVDSSVGGKVAVNHPSGKNLIGAFHPPRAVWAALETLSTLPPDELRCGWGEVLKTALVADPDLFERLERGPVGVVDAVERCVRAKARIVGADEREDGPRIVLNAGHTVAHALEAAVGPSLRHGEAVAIGLVVEARHAVRLGVCADPDLPERIARAARAAGLPTEPPPVGGDRLLAAMRLDKKSSADKIRVPLPVRVGEMQIIELPRTEWTFLVAPPTVHG